MTAIVKSTTQAIEYDGIRPLRKKAVKVLIIVDGSASMSPWTDKTKKALASFLDGLRKDKETHYLVSCIWFSGNVTVQCLARPLKDVNLDYWTEADTALWDGIWRGFEVEIERIDPVLCLIISDGYETSSRVVPVLAAKKELSSEEFIKMQIQIRESWGNWTFCWLGMAKTASQATRVGVKEAIDFSRDDVFNVLTNLSDRVKKFAHNLRLTGAKQGKLLT